jgi:FKBP-type peptidyl-prolyl cis-trans isomerase SlyD
MMVSAHDPSGQQIPLIVIHLDDTTARLDANHPFAGKDVIFNVTVTQVENATEDEIAHGHMH